MLNFYRCNPTENNNYKLWAFGLFFFKNYLKESVETLQIGISVKLMEKKEFKLDFK